MSVSIALPRTDDPIDGAQIHALVEPPRKIACGFYHSVAIDSKDAPWGWGRNQHNMLGLREDEGTSSRLRPTQLSSVNKSILEVACGANHTVFLQMKDNRPGGTVWSTGLGNGGRLGNADKDEEVTELDLWWTKENPLRTQLPNRVRALRVVCGGNHTLCLCTDRKLYAWGENAHGQCGTDSTAQQHRRPAQVKFTEENLISHIAAGAQHSFALDDGAVWAWGRARNGRLGTGDSNQNLFAPVVIESTLQNGMVFVAAGEAHSGSIDKTGRVYTWGSGSHGKLGHVNDADIFMPKAVTAFDTSDGSLSIKAIALGGFHSIFLEGHPNSGRLHGCGNGAAVGLLSERDNSGISSPQPLSMPSQSPVVQICAGMFHCLALLEDGEIISWGVGAHGRLGTGREVDEWRPIVLKRLQPGVDDYREACLWDSARLGHQKEISTLRSENLAAGATYRDYEIADISCGRMHTFARSGGGLLFGWGCNASGQLGFGEPGTDGSAYFWTPKQLYLDKKVIKQVSCGHEYTLAVTMVGELWAWGHGENGQLGLGGSQEQLTPQHVSSLSQVQTCGAGENHSAAIVKTKMGKRQLFTWGNAANGVLGLGQYITSSTQYLPQLVDFGQADEHSDHPLSVVCGPNSTAVICGDETALQKISAGKEAGEPANSAETWLWTFGNGWYGRLGHGNTNSQFTPRQVHFQFHKVSIHQVSCGADHTCAVSKTGSLWGWGKGSQVLQQGTDDDVLQPKMLNIDQKTLIRSVVCSEAHTLAVARNGTLYSWGDNGNGQLGIGSDNEYTYVPLKVEQNLQPEKVISISSGGEFTVALLTNKELYAWGNQSCGRLGLVAKNKGQTVWNPGMVVSGWKTAEASSAEAMKQKKQAILPQEDKKKDNKGTKEKAEESKEGEEDAESSQAPPKADEEEVKPRDMHNIISFVMLQTLLKQEEPRYQQQALKLHAARLEAKLADLLKLDALQQEEKECVKLQTQLGESFTLNLKHWRNKTTAPKTGSPAIDPRISGLLPVYKQILWVLLHQAYYLTRLSDRVSGSEERTYFDIVDNIFANKHDAWVNIMTQNLCRMMAAQEAEMCLKASDFLHHKTSKAFKLFSRTVLNPAFAADVVHPFMGDTKGTMLAEIVTVSGSNTFFTNLSDFRDYLGDVSAYDELEIKNKYAANLDILNQFMRGPFIEAIKKVKLPDFVVTCLKFALVFKTSLTDGEATTDRDISSDLRPYEPGMRMFYFGILHPLLSEAPKYAQKAYLLKKSSDLIKGDPTSTNNMEAIASFLDQTMSNGIDPKEKNLLMLAKNMRNSLLMYVRDQCAVEDHFETSLLLAAAKGQFTRIGHYIQMGQGDLMKMSNLLKAYSSKLRLQEHDVLDTLCKDIPEWSADSVYMAERSGEHFNFHIDSAYMKDEEDIVMCPQSLCPLPARVCPERATKRLVELPDDQIGGAAVTFFEGLFRQLRPIESETFLGLREELRALHRQLNENAARGDMSQAQLVQDLDKAGQLIGEMIDAKAAPRELINSLVQRAEARNQHATMLDYLENNLQNVKAAKLEYKRELETAKKELAQANQKSLDLVLPKKIQSVMTRHGHTPMFNIFQKRIDQSAGLSTKAMADLGCSYVPMATYPVAKLKKMKVLVDIHPPFTTMQKIMEITIRKLDKDSAEVVASVTQGGTQNIVKRMTVPKEKLEELKHANQSDVAELCNPGETSPFLTLWSLNFISLLGNLEKGSTSA
eukprot:TRINITY_DN36354_c0_g1_i1.p1 TRINITY_DN36354_c0_g1~~TRINITY_DN36354_c0_g1_i1.p1  ORF type:complete len:1720 (+),score=309.26 TRINITY_DN36354_c0_g1_i1:45-5204(+)